MTTEIDRALFWMYDDTGQPLQCSWQQFRLWEQSKPDWKRVAKIGKIGKYLISTVFLNVNVNHQFYQGPPVLLETMIFSRDKSLDEMHWRYTSLEAAKRGHQRIVDIVAASRNHLRTWRMIDGNGDIRELSPQDRAHYRRTSKRLKRLGMPDLFTTNVRAVPALLRNIPFIT